MTTGIEVRSAESVAEVLAAGALFDAPPRTEWARRFLESPGHHLLLAYRRDGQGGEGEPVGVVTGVEMTHPDKGTEMFLYELSVAEAHQRQGIGRHLVDALARLAREGGCYGMWVGVDTDNEPALATYRSARGEREADAAMVIWDWGSGSASP